MFTDMTVKLYAALIAIVSLIVCIAIFGFPGLFIGAILGACLGFSALERLRDLTPEGRRRRRLSMHHEGLR